MYTIFRLPFVAAAALACLPALAWAEGGQSPQMDLPHARLTVGVHHIDAQLASTDTQRATGLMYRREMPQNEGMLFVFEQPGVQCFWMRNTLIPLTAAFVADDGSIVNLADMQPLDESTHCSARPVRYVLEMNQGWFNQRHVQPGHKLRGQPFVAPQAGTQKAGAVSRKASAP